MNPYSRLEGWVYQATLDLAEPEVLREELRRQMLQRIHALEQQGLTPSQAEHQVLEQAGNPTERCEQLARTHATEDEWEELKALLSTQSWRDLSIKDRVVILLTICFLVVLFFFTSRNPILVLLFVVPPILLMSCFKHYFKVRHWHFALLFLRWLERLFVKVIVWPILFALSSRRPLDPIHFTLSSFCIAAVLWSLFNFSDISKQVRLLPKLRFYVARV